MVSRPLGAASKGFRLEVVGSSSGVCGKAAFVGGREVLLRSLLLVAPSPPRQSDKRPLLDFWRLCFW